MPEHFDFAAAFLNEGAPRVSRGSYVLSSGSTEEEPLNEPSDAVRAMFGQNRPSATAFDRRLLMVVVPLVVFSKTLTP